jgi:dihydrofolate reductase
MRKIIVYVATSADGFIARTDGDIEWLNRAQSAGDYGMAEFYELVDTVLMGRKTYDIALKFGQTSYAGKKNYIFSRSTQPSDVPEVEFINRDVSLFARELRGAVGRDIWLVGGGELIASFLDAGCIDEFIIHIVPTLIGEGIPLIAPRHRNIPLTLLSSLAYNDGVVRLHYAVSGDKPGEKRARKAPRQQKRR